MNIIYVRIWIGIGDIGIQRNEPTTFSSVPREKCPFHTLSSVDYYPSSSATVVAGILVADCCPDRSTFKAIPADPGSVDTVDTGGKTSAPLED